MQSGWMICLMPCWTRSGRPHDVVDPALPAPKDHPDEVARADQNRPQSLSTGASLHARAGPKVVRETSRLHRKRTSHRTAALNAPEICHPALQREFSGAKAAANEGFRTRWIAVRHSSSRNSEYHVQQIAFPRGEPSIQ